MSIYSLFDISGRKALVTGAGRGIGKVLALALGEAGCDVALFGLHLQNLEPVGGGCCPGRGGGRGAGCPFWFPSPRPWGQGRRPPGAGVYGWSGPLARGSG